ncbi:MAG: Uma2 family endonuclease [Vulcanimicrobiota bacterium]
MDNNERASATGDYSDKLLAQRQRRLFTPEEYLAIEEKSPTKSEYYQGEIFAMSGASLAHAQIVRNLTADLHNALRGSSCQVFGSDLRLQVTTSGLFTYPDLYVVCGEPVLLSGRTDTVTDATLIVEVLSPSTEFYDRGEKFLLYQGLPSFREYLLVSQDQKKIEYHVKSGRNSWRSDIIEENSLTLESIGHELSLEEVYREVKPLES